MVNRLIAVSIIFLMGAGIVVAQVTTDTSERIISFESNIDVTETGTLNIKEAIVYDFGLDERHGIFRRIPLVYDSGDKQISIEALRVLDGLGREYPFTSSIDGDYLDIRIGDPDVLVGGVRTYALEYSVDGAINAEEERDVLIWNVTGNLWSVPISKATIELTGFSEEIISSGSFSCYEGPVNSVNECSSEKLGSGSYFALAEMLLPGEGITVAVSWSDNLLNIPTGGDVSGPLSEYLIFLIPLIAMILLFLRWWKHGRDPKGRGVTVPQYEPPKDISPIEVGALASGSVKPVHISAEILSLAVRGYLKIALVTNDSGSISPRDYMIVKINELSDAEPLFDKVIMTNLFSTFKDANSGTQSVSISELKNSFYRHLQPIKSSVYESLVKKGFYKRTPAGVMGRYFLVSFVIFFASFFLILHSVSVMISAMATAFIVAIFGLFMPKVTQKGALVKEEIAGFQKYLDMAEKDRLNFHNSPEKTPEKFEEFLPYALALDVVDAWARQFADIYKEPPDWYDSRPGTQFSAIALVGDIKEILPRHGERSSRGSHQASGRFSGGGAGGGGGGSW